LRVPPSNRFHALSGERKGQYALWINRRRRVVFRWRAGNAHDVEMVDDHG
jgi:proteic killer suppression protein